MRIPFKIEKQEFSLPTSWYDITTGEFFKIRNSKQGSLTSLLEAISGVDEKTWEQIPVSSIDKLFTKDNEGYGVLKFLENQMDFPNLTLPSLLTIDGKKYPVPLDADLTYGQKNFMQERISKEATERDILNAAVFCLACYYHPIVTGEKFDSIKAIEFEKIINEKTLIHESFPVANFFLLQLRGLQSEMPTHYHISLQKRKVLRALRSWMCLDKQTPLMHSQAGTYSNGRQYLTSLMRWCSQNFGSQKKKHSTKEGFLKSETPK